MSKETWLTVEELRKKYDYSVSAYTKRRKQCLLSPFQDAIVYDGQHTMIIEERWQAFLKDRSKKHWQEVFGTQLVRDRRALEG
ncbi:MULTISPECIES: hypothetical protein [Lactobacillus]|uniref:Excisionase n=3 Tax=Lactobacillus TaxID=1578 RepID=A0AB33C4E4_LACGS|nr:MULTISPECIES: hypothetical protein [Lactobacillus]ART99125.1 hypothetical protein CCE30_09625 [Lactobacillus gasseri]MBV6739521.1 hypothetical protein [Lactobacillus gasseri CECT 5714]MDK6868439.1 hypothetical protein [Lactobacillus paragasseri]MDX5080148.1 hypothetical protein [Lactobacillus paragasseri]QTP20653.1 hypothetical protein J7S35_001134 [Lactobacillus gasseri]